MKFVFGYTETVRRRFVVEADTEEQARERFWLDTSSEDEITDVIACEIDYIESNP